MKVIIAGSRTILNSYPVVQAIAESGWADEITEVVCGMAPGVDLLGWRWAKEHGIPVKEFRADWATLGKTAGFIRNGLMARYADALIAITNGSPGTKDMIESARRSGLRVYVRKVRR